MVARFVGMALMGLLALACVLEGASWLGIKMDFLPSWVPLISNKPGTRANSPRPSEQRNVAASGRTPAPNTNPAQPNPTPTGPALGKGTLVAMNEPAKEATKPTAPAMVKPADEPDPFAENTAVKPAAKPAVEPDASTPAKPEAPARPDDLFSAPPAVAPVNEKGKADIKPEAKPAAEPDVPAATKPEPAAKPEEDLFGSPPVVAPVKENSKAHAKPEAKPAVEPGVPAPAKASPPAKPDEDLFGSPPAETKPDPTLKVPSPVAPETPSKPDAKPEIAPNAPKTAGLKPDASPVIGPEPKPESMPEVKPDAKPAVKPAAGVGPLQAQSFTATELDASLKAVSGVTTVDAKSYADWCKLAEVVTYVEDGGDSQRQKQALQILGEHAASSPTAVSAIAASAKKLLDDKATKGGIVLAGMVTGLATKNGLNGTALRMEGMDKPVMIFSARPLGVKETEKVIVFGALVADPAKNLPGYPGKQSVVVWSNFATEIP
jgi:hypothetical protein